MKVAPIINIMDSPITMKFHSRENCRIYYSWSFCVYSVHKYVKFEPFVLELQCSNRPARSCARSNVWKHHILMWPVQYGVLVKNSGSGDPQESGERATIMKYVYNFILKRSLTILHFIVWSSHRLWASPLRSNLSKRRYISLQNEWIGSSQCIH